MYNKSNVTGLISCMAFEFKRKPLMKSWTSPGFKKNPARRLPVIMIEQRKGQKRKQKVEDAWGMHGCLKGRAGIRSARNSVRKTGTHHGSQWDHSWSNRRHPRSRGGHWANNDIIYQVHVAGTTIMMKMSNEMKNDRMCIRKEKKWTTGFRKEIITSERMSVRISMERRLILMVGGFLT